ncbi:MAG: hypothetical protein ABI587_02145 [Gemmatimonadales bacterium]
MVIVLVQVWTFTLWRRRIGQSPDPSATKLITFGFLTLETAGCLLLARDLWLRSHQ